MPSSAIAILAGGLGTRMQDELLGRPKALAPLVKGHSLLELVIRAAGSRKLPVTIVVDPRSAPILRQAINGAGIEWIVDGGVGTGGAVRALLDRGAHERYVLMNCDTLTPIRVLDLVNADSPPVPIRQHATRHSTQNDGLIGIAPHGETVVHWGEVTKEKPDFSLEPASSSGIYEIQRTAISEFPRDSESFENQILPLVVEKGDLSSVLHPSERPTIDFGSKASYEHLRFSPAVKFAVLREMGLLWI